MFENSFNQNCYGSIPSNSFFPTNRTTRQVGGLDKSGEAYLIYQAQHGDLTAFNELVLLYQDAVYRQAYWILAEVEAAEEAAQEAFLRVYRNLQTFRSGLFKPWMLRITTNYCLDQLRHLKSRPTTPLEVLNEYDEEMEPPAWLADPSDSPEKMIEHAESETTIMQCIQPPASIGSKVVEFFMKGGAFIMEEGMIKGIRLRAEGGIEPAWVEPMGDVVWLLALMTGLAAGVLFIVRKLWQGSLGVGVAAILALLAFTYLQPVIWVRLLVDLALLPGVSIAVRIKP